MPACVALAWTPKTRQLPSNPAALVSLVSWSVTLHLPLPAPSRAAAAHISLAAGAGRCNLAAYFRVSRPLLTFTLTLPSRILARFCNSALALASGLESNRREHENARLSPGLCSLLACTRLLCNLPPAALPHHLHLPAASLLPAPRTFIPLRAWNLVWWRAQSYPAFLIRAPPFNSQNTSLTQFRCSSHPSRRTSRLILPAHPLSKPPPRRRPLSLSLTCVGIGSRHPRTRDATQVDEPLFEFIQHDAAREDGGP